MTDPELKLQVGQFYNQVGWQQEADGSYQNARYEDLRPVSREYIHRCHMRVSRHIPQTGRFLLDAGSGPVQYPEYLTYSKNYQKRICLDISILALEEARKRLGSHGLYVVADVSRLPFKSNCMDGFVSLHTLHHLTSEDQELAYFNLQRVLKEGGQGVVVNGWTQAPFMVAFNWLVHLMEWIGSLVLKLRGRQVSQKNATITTEKPTGTFTARITPQWLRDTVGKTIPIEIFVWRSASVRFLRAVIHPALAGRFWLKLLYGMEERWPHYFGEKGQYPLIVVHKRLSEG